MVFEGCESRKSLDKQIRCDTALHDDFGHSPVVRGSCCTSYEDENLDVGS